ncbi:MAG: DUF1178 family protein [Burkholderiales bacterium]|nr:DUF1178 family protein [Burkholderiales bacterium]
MKVLNLRCANGHGFEGWFASEDDFLDQNGRAVVECPLCADRVITRMPSAPRLNLSGARAPQPAQASPSPAPQPVAAQPGPSQPGAQPPAGADLQVAWLAAARRLVETTEDVGARFPEEARRIHYGESEPRGIRGQATPEEREALREEGIEVVAMPLPAALKGPLQ